jgi:methyl halide transferase
LSGSYFALEASSKLRNGLGASLVLPGFETVTTEENAMKEDRDWNESYREGNLPWDTGRPSSELQRVFNQHAIRPCRALEIGCGTGTNCIWLAQQGFEVTGIDLAALAVEQAEQRARAADVKVRFIVADVLQLPDVGGPFDFFFDRGCYHAVRRNAPEQYAPAVTQQLAPGGRGLILAGNAREPNDPGPPVVTEEQIRHELGLAFEILDLREFRFDEAPGVPARFLGWSCLIEKR